jgi:hypothetical protein
MKSGGEARVKENKEKKEKGPKHGKGHAYAYGKKGKEAAAQE